jgi:hypothetical protein
MTSDIAASENQGGSQDLTVLIRELDEKMSQSANLSSNQAFNLGCFVGLIPAGVIVLLAYFSAGSSWVGALVMVVLMGLSLILFANLVAAISRKNTLRRVFLTEISPEIRSAQVKFNLEPAEFHLAASEALPPGAALLEFLPLPQDLKPGIETE